MARADAGGAGGGRTSAHRGVMRRGCFAVAVHHHRAATRRGTAVRSLEESIRDAVTLACGSSTSYGNNK